MSNDFRRRPAVLLTSTASVGLLLSGCFGGSGGTAGDAAQNLVISLQFTPRSNWAMETDDSMILTQLGCGETLTRFNTETNELEALLATDWEQTEPTAWEFTLREGVTFQDGTELTADAVVRSLEHILAAEAPPRAFTPTDIEAVEAVDDLTVRITTPTESSIIPFRVAASATAILADSAYGDAGISIEGTCTGPYEVVSQVTSQSVSLAAHADYWGDAAQIETVEARFFAEGSTRATQVRTGESDIALAVPVSSIADLEADADVVVSQAYTPRTGGLYFNNSRAPFDDVEVRRAVQEALDLEAIVDSVYGGVGQPAVGPFAPDSAWAPESATPVALDVDAAAQRLADAGYAPGEIEVTLLAYTERAEFADLAAVIQEQLGAIGITVTISMSDYAGVEPSLLEGDYDIALLSRNQLTDIADPAAFLTADYTCEGGYNLSQFCEPAFDERLAEAIGESDPELRHSIYAELAERLQDEAITAFIIHEETVAATRTTVTGFVDDPLARYAITNQLAFTEG